MSEVADGPEIQVIGRSGLAADSRSLGHRFGHQADDLILADDAEVVVGQEGQNPSSLERAGVEDDRPGLRDPQGTAR